MLYSDINDETLVMLTLAGEQRAYEALVVRYQKAVTASAYSVTHSNFMAQDAAQDAFVTAWMKLNVLREPEKFGVWVCRIAKNCALNMITRYRFYINLDDVGEDTRETDEAVNPQTVSICNDEKELLYKSINLLPEKVRQTVKLFYFEELSVSEIADKMKIAPGTVKRQLFDGRKRIRKELCSMNEEMNDTLVIRVRKKVEELKAWHFLKNKKGFEEKYNEVLSQAEDLPESEEKHNALADVLSLGWWWLPGKQNDELFERIRESAVKGKNDEVMRFIVTRQDSKTDLINRGDFILNTQIPELEKYGFTLCLGSEWFWLGDRYYHDQKSDKGNEAYEKAVSILPDNDIFKALAARSLENGKKLCDEYLNAGKDENKYRIVSSAQEFRFADGSARGYRHEYTCNGGLYSFDTHVDFVLDCACRCDGYFTYDGLEAGQSYTGSDGCILTYVSDSEEITVPAGTFTGCKVWRTRDGESVCTAYYKEGVGIVRLDRECDGFTDTRVLKSYDIPGGSGLLPLYRGNSWEYSSLYNEDVIAQSSEIRVTYTDNVKAIISQGVSVERFKYDENSWLDMIQQIRVEYLDDKRYRDVMHAVERAEALASTSLEKAHTRAACSVARRILETYPQFNPDYTQRGYWNFFTRKKAVVRDGGTDLIHNYRWSFELKRGDGGVSQTAVLFNDIYGILRDALDCVWSDSWLENENFTNEYKLWSRYDVKTRVHREFIDEMTVKAGTFKDCLRLSLDIDKYSEGHAYRTGKKDYYFAKGIGIIKVENLYCSDTVKAVYELTSYEGSGKGYMPFADGLVRRYDAIDLNDGYKASAEYVYAADEYGDITIFADRCGVKNKEEKITSYEAVHGEVLEDDLWNSGKHDESRLRHCVNNFNILSHFLCRNSRYWGSPGRAVVWNQYRMKLIENINEDGTVPDGWLGFYAATCFRTACALFGRSRNDEGYEYLDRSFTLFEKWFAIPDGEALGIGDDVIYGGIKVIKNGDVIELPDKTREPAMISDAFYSNRNLLYYGLTAKHGWEWFNGVREEERYKKAVERAKKLCDGK